METRIDEIADRVYRLSTFVAAAGPPAGFTFNQFLIDAEEPLLFHCGQRSLFPSISAAAARVLGDGEWLDLGGKEVQRIDTPHVPHSWDAGLLYEKTTGTLFCSDLFTHLGDPPALTDGDIVGPAIAAEERFHLTSLTPDTGATMRRLAALEPRRLAVMHGSSYSGPVAPALEALADYYDGKLRQAMTRAT